MCTLCLYTQEFSLVCAKKTIRLQNEFKIKNYHIFSIIVYNIIVI